MVDKPRLYGYYIFFVLLMAFTAAAVIYTLSKAGAAKADSVTAAKTLEISSQLQSYLNKYNSLPPTIDDAGVNSVPSSISYAKITGGYMLCVNYKNAAIHNPFSSVPLRASGLSFNGQMTGQSTVDINKLVYLHKSGQNCQKIFQPSKALNANSQLAQAALNNLLSKNKTKNPSSTDSLIAAKCGDNGTSFELMVRTTIKSVDAGQGVITLNTTGAILNDKNDAPLKSLPTIKYDAATMVYGTNCKKMTIDNLGALKTATPITVYLYSHDSTYADQIEL